MSFEEINDNNFIVSSSPHISSKLTTKKIMLDVLIGLLPLVVVSIYFFKFYAIKQILICLLSCLFAEAFFTKLRGKKFSLNDYSASITAIILALSMPATAPWFVSVIASFVAIGIGKIVFGGLGMNIFNPAMVGRAFVMIAFASLLGAGAYEMPNSTIDILSQATPMTAFKQSLVPASILKLLIGNTNGSLGETSAIACIIGGIYLCVRKVASWEIPLSILFAVFICALIQNVISPTSSFGIFEHIFGGALLFGAFFIATDPVTSPITFKGKFIFGLGIGFFIMILRLFSGYPEGVMFAVLLMNSVTPLINKWTKTKALGVK